MTAATIAHTKLLNMTLGGKKYLYGQACKLAVNFHLSWAKRRATHETSSKLKSTPPTGAPKATATPAAHAAERTSLLFASLRSNFGKNRQVILPMHEAMCTKGPSLPRLRPEPTAKHRPTALARLWSKVSNCHCCCVFCEVQNLQCPGTCLMHDESQRSPTVDVNITAYPSNHV